MDYWIEFFQLDTTFDIILSKFAPEVKIYPDVIQTLERLKKKYPLIVITAMPREFIKPKMTALSGYFNKIYSCLSDFKSLKTSSCYKSICNDLNIRPDELLHIGDHQEFDFLAAKSAGVNVVLLDRSGKITGFPAIRSLTELEIK